MMFLPDDLDFGFTSYEVDQFLPGNFSSIPSVLVDWLDAYIGLTRISAGEQADPRPPLMLRKRCSVECDGTSFAKRAKHDTANGETNASSPRIWAMADGAEGASASISVLGEEEPGPILRSILRLKNLMESKYPWATLNHLRHSENKCQILADIECALHNYQPSIPSTLALLAAQPQEIQHDIFGHVVDEDWTWRREGCNDYGQVHGPFRKFQTEPRDIIVQSAVFGPSQCCPEFLPAACKRGELSRLGIGSAFIQKANFIFVERNAWPRREIEWFRNFLEHFPDGISHVRQITMPFLLQYTSDRYKLVKDCHGLSHLTIGISQDLIETNTLSEGPSNIIVKEQLDTLFSMKKLRECVMVLGPSPYHSYESRDPEACQSVFEELGREMLRGFRTQGNSIVTVVVDWDTNWDRAIPYPQSARKAFN